MFVKPAAVRWPTTVGPVQPGDAPKGTEIRRDRPALAVTKQSGIRQIRTTQINRSRPRQKQVCANQIGILERCTIGLVRR